ncbi:IS66 family transposase zinc-finger binding domain-containing protein [Streptococcus mitis]|uniref:IS66 family transposase zinc-finger binding domain-containing protein n=1 Tax=Streptococcus mitis TaxID=28037 RepID=UPI0015E0E22B|nr:IS66 family transposase zinc-finger binding domain-containing protein [Streptococcus mitis]
MTIEYCICPYCQGNLKEIGATIQRQELNFVPSQLKIVDYIQCAYNTMDISYI